MKPELELIQGDAPWQEVFERWRQREVGDPQAPWTQGWVDCATNVKGWESWEAWRLFMAEQLHLSDRRWDILKVMEHADLSEWRIGPTQGWQRLFEEDAELRKVPLLERTFGQLVRAKPEWVRGHKAIADIQGNFPAETELMALALPEGGIMAFEGHHRITALVAARLLDNRPLPRGDIRVALSYLNPGDVARLPEVIRRGSDRVDKGNWPY